MLIQDLCFQAELEAMKHKHQKLWSSNVLNLLNYNLLKSRIGSAGMQSSGKQSENEAYWLLLLLYV